MMTRSALMAHVRHYRRACLTYGWTPSPAGLLAYIDQRERGLRALWETPPPLRMTSKKAPAS